MSHQVVVVGLGGMGSAAAAHLCRRGVSVLGLEQFGPAHDRGSSHGDTRVIRQAYYEDPRYVPLLLRAYELWEELNLERPGLFVPTGGLMLGEPDAATVVGSLASARQWDLPHEMLDARDLRRRFPTFDPGDRTVALFEERAGYVRPEETVRTHLARAAAAGADLRFHTPATGWDVTSDGVVVHTAEETFRADHLVVTAGAWAPRLLADLDLPLWVERQLLYWFEPRDDLERYRAPHHPVFIWDIGEHLQLYGFPALDGAGEGVKVAFYRGAGDPVDPDQLDRGIHPEEVELMRRSLERHVPGLAGRFLRGLACMYTNTPDFDFVVATHPARPQVTIAAGFSGHGFKFVPVIGEILADLALDGSTRHPIAMFAPDRFRSTVSPGVSSPPATGMPERFS